MSKKRRKTPTRSIGEIKGINYKISPGEKIEKAGDLKFKLPDQKEACELHAAKAVQEIYKLYIETPKGNFYFSDFDFTNVRNHQTVHGPDIDLVWRGIDAYAELFEVAPLKGTHDTAPRIYNVGEMADWIRKQILNKKRKYENKKYEPIFLIMYWSDNAFLPDENTLLHVVRDLKVGLASIFSGIFSVSFRGTGEPIVFQLYPQQHNFPFSSRRILPFGDFVLGKDIFPVRCNQVVNAAPEAAEIQSGVVSSDGSYEMTLRIKLPDGTNVDEFIRRIIEGGQSLELDSFSPDS